MEDENIYDINIYDNMSTNLQDLLLMKSKLGVCWQFTSFSATALFLAFPAALQCYTFFRQFIQFSTVKCILLKCSAFQCNAVQCSMYQCCAEWLCAVQCIQCILTVVQCISVKCRVFQTVDCRPLPCSYVLQFPPDCAQCTRQWCEAVAKCTVI